MRGFFWSSCLCLPGTAIGIGFFEIGERPEEGVSLWNKRGLLWKKRGLLLVWRWRSTQQSQNGLFLHGKKKCLPIKTLVSRNCREKQNQAVYSSVVCDHSNGPSPFSLPTLQSLDRLRQQFSP